MTSFTDPRDHMNPGDKTCTDRTTTNPEELEELRQLCRDGHLYEVERWIQEGRPLQLQKARPAGRRRWSSALEIALEDGNHALALLLLCNGYDPNREHHCPLNRALEDRRLDLLDLLLKWGADPHQVDLRTLFCTYESDLFERFRELGVDLTAHHALAAALGYHTSNKPLYGYAKRRRKTEPKIQMELNIALAHHAGEGNEKGLNLCLWAGADPHAPAPSLRYGDWTDKDDDEEGRFVGFSAVHEACSRGQAEILEKLNPDPEVDDFDDLYATTESRAVIELLAKQALPENLEYVIDRHLLRISFRSGGWGSLWALESLFEFGARWESSSTEAIAGLRQRIIRLSDRTFIDLMKLLAKDDHCSSEILTELARTPAMRRRMKEVGFIPPGPDDPDRHGWHRKRPTRFREVLKKCGIERKKPKRPLPQTVHIGSRRSGGQEIRMDRQEFFKRVWSTPLYKLAEEWGLSDTGLRKKCQRLKVPTPGRGYWQKVKAGKKVCRPSLPEIPDGEAEEVVVWAPQ